jgi:hypothetical protein
VNSKGDADEVLDGDEDTAGNWKIPELIFSIP